MMIDVLVFGGQSNKQGRTEGIPNPNVPIQDALEYHYLTDKLIPLAHPVGETIADG